MARAVERAGELGFEQSCEAEVGRLLAVLAASVPRGGRILEIGTGAGFGTAWLAEGADATPGVELVTVDANEALVRRVAKAGAGWPGSVRFVVGDALDLVPGLGRFDLVFADAVAGKWYGLDLTIAALAPGGVLVVDDMAPARWTSGEHEARTAAVRAALMADARLVVVELVWASGVIVATRRARPAQPAP